MRKIDSLCCTVVVGNFVLLTVIWVGGFASYQLSADSTQFASEVRLGFVQPLPFTFSAFILRTAEAVFPMMCNCRSTDTLTLSTTQFNTFRRPICWLVFLVFHTFINSTIHSSIHQLSHSFIHSFINSSIHSFIHLFSHSFTHSSSHSFINSASHLFIHLFGHSFINSLIFSSIHSFKHSSNHSTIHSFIPSFLHSPTNPSTKVFIPLSFCC